MATSQVWKRKTVDCVMKLSKDTLQRARAEDFFKL